MLILFYNILLCLIGKGEESINLLGHHAMIMKNVYKNKSLTSRNIWLKVWCQQIELISYGGKMKSKVALTFIWYIVHLTMERWGD